MLTSDTTTHLPKSRKVQKRFKKKTKHKKTDRNHSRTIEKDIVQKIKDRQIYE